MSVSQGLTSSFSHSRELYDKYGFSEYMEEEDGKETEDPLVTMAAEFTRKVDQIQVSVSHTQKVWRWVVLKSDKTNVNSFDSIFIVCKLAIITRGRHYTWTSCSSHLIASLCSISVL